MKLVQMPTELIHLEDADLEERGIEPGLLAAFRAYLSDVLDDWRGLADRRGLAILAPTPVARPLLMVLARRIGVALRDANIHLRERGGDLKAGRQKLCYLPGTSLAEVLAAPDTRPTLVGEAACFFEGLDTAWQERDVDDSTDAPSPQRADGRVATAALEPPAVLALLAILDERLAAGRPTFLTADPGRLPLGLETALRARFPVLEALPS